jgi:preprotein translocase subunit SecG
MANVLIVAYLLIVLALIAVILLQRSEGGGLGMGSSSAGIMTVRGSANLLTRTTAILAALFMATAIGLTINSGLERGSSRILEGADTVGEGAGTDITVLDRLNQLSGAGRDESLAVPQTAPAESGKRSGARGARGWRGGSAGSSGALRGGNASGAGQLRRGGTRGRKGDGNIPFFF